MSEQLAVDMREAARRLGLSPRTIAKLISAGEMPSRKVGRRRIIPIRALEAFANGVQSQRKRHPKGAPSKQADAKRDAAVISHRDASTL